MTKVIKSVCFMCGSTYGGCGIDVHVEDNKIIKIEGTKGHPVNDGRLCAKGLAALQLQYDPNRLSYPMKRVGNRGEGKWKRISWDEAMDTIVTRLKGIIETDGIRAISWLKGQGPGWESGWDYPQRFMNAIGSPNIVTYSHVCHIARVIGHLFSCGTMPDPDWDNTRCMLLWGNNPVNRSASSATRRIMRAKQRGAKLIVIDPRFTKTAAKADLFIQPRPGSDGALALGMLNVIIGENLYDKEFVNKWTYGFDKLTELVKKFPPKEVEQITWVPANAIREVARVYATTKPACLHEANGVDQNPAVVQTTRAIDILRAITGNLDVPGGNIFDPEAPPFLRTVDMSMRKTAPEDIENAFRESVSTHPVYFLVDYVTVPELIDSILTEEPYEIKAIIAQGTNPAIVTSNAKRAMEALKKVEFLVVFDRFMNATAELADIILPATTFFERTLYTHFREEPRPRMDATSYQLMPKIVEPLGECKSDYDFISELARRMGYGWAFPWKSVEEAIDYELKPIGLSCKELEKRAEPVFKHKYSPEELYRKYEKFFSSPLLRDKKYACYSAVLENYGYDPLPRYIEPGESPVSRPDLLKEYPLVCMAGLKPGLYTHTQFHSLPWLKEIMPDPWIEIHFQKAEELGIRDGDLVVVESLRGSIEIKCKTIDTMDPRVVAITHGWGDRYVTPQPITNILTPHDIRCPISDSTSNRCFLVKVIKKV